MNFERTDMEEYSNLDELRDVMLTPYIQKATALIGKPRKIGGNQFRHMMATLAILIDYKITDSVILKASVIHDLLEELPETQQDLILNADNDGSEVLKIVKELTKKDDESKVEYLLRLKESASYKAAVIKLADRISNLTDINTDIFDYEFIARYIDETEQYIMPMALEINYNMYVELADLVKRKRRLLTTMMQLKNVMKNIIKNKKDKK